MGTFIGHVIPGFGFILIGLWHLFNHTKLFAINHDKYISLPWFPSTFICRVRHAELYVLMIGCTASVAMELVICPDRHTPFDPDGTIPSNHMQNFEHASISLTFFVYAVFALAFDKLLNRDSRPAHNKILQLMGGVAFAQQLLLFHLHSSDHVGLEGHYHWLLQLVVLVSLGTALLGIAWARSFIPSYVRSLSVVFQGAWLMLMGLMLWTPELFPKGCFMNREVGHTMVRWNGEKWLNRAKSLVNIVFSWLLIGSAVFATSFYLLMIWVYGGGADYVKVVQEEGDRVGLLNF